MANYTPNISLKKPLPSDNVSLSDINTNYDKIDSEFGGVLLRVEQNEQDISQIADYVVERGTTNGWEWEKWKSGKATFWIVDVQTTTFKQEGSLYYGDTKTLTLPFAVSIYVSTAVDCTEDYLGCITAGLNATQYRYRIFAPSSQSTKPITARIRLEVKI